MSAFKVTFLIEVVLEMGISHLLPLPPPPLLNLRQGNQPNL